MFLVVCLYVAGWCTVQVWLVALVVFDLGWVCFLSGRMVVFLVLGFGVICLFECILLN